MADRTGSCTSWPPIRTDFAAYHTAEADVGSRGVVMVCIRSCLDHNAGQHADMQDLMMDYYINANCSTGCLTSSTSARCKRIKAALEAGV